MNNKNFIFGILIGLVIIVLINSWFIYECRDSNRPNSYFSFLGLTPGGGVCQSVGPVIDGQDSPNISLGKFIFTRFIFLPPLTLISIIFIVLFKRLFIKKK